MPAINLAHETFILEMIAHGDRLLAYKKAYPRSSHQAAYINACRLLSKRSIKERISAAVRLAETQVEYELTEKLKGQFMDTMEKRKELARIIRGQVAIPKQVTKRNRSYIVLQAPNIREILTAIALDTQIESSWFRK